MEIQLGDGYYCLNPRGIIYVKYYVAPRQYEDDERYQFPPDMSKDEMEQRIHPNMLPNFDHCIKIKTANGEDIIFNTEDIEYYNNIKAKLENI